MKGLKKEFKNEKERFETKISQLKQKEQAHEEEIGKLRNELLSIKSLLVNADGPKLEGMIGVQVIKL